MIQMVQVGQVDLVDQVVVKEDTIKATNNNREETHKSKKWDNKSMLISASVSEVSEIPFQKQSVTSW